MKIVCIAASFIPSNTANSIQVMKACQGLVAAGHAVTLLVPGDMETDWADLQDHYGVQHSFDIHWIPENLRFKRYDFAWKAVQEGTRMKPDLVYTWVLQAAVFALWKKIPTMLEMHDRVTGRVGPWLFRQFWNSKTPKRLLTITAALKRALMADFNLSGKADQILLAPDGVDLARYQGLPSPEDAREQLGLKPGFTAGYTGHFYAGRGLDLMYNLAKALPEVQFLWVGGDPTDVTLWQKRINSAKISNIKLTGFVPNQELPSCQAACDLLLMPYSDVIAGSGGGNTAQIASPMKMFEYMAAGRAIISSDLPVIHEVLDADSALFCPPDDLPAWKAAIQFLMKDPGRRRQLATTAQSYSRKYTWEARSRHALENFPEPDLESLQQ